MTLQSACEEGARHWVGPYVERAQSRGRDGRLPFTPLGGLLRTMETGSDVVALTEADCLQLLASTEVGRVGVIVDGQPFIFPVIYVLDGRYVVFHTNWAKLSGFCHVAFEIDSFDPTTRSRWSVLVQGMGHDITGSIDRTSEHLQTVPVVPWVPGPTSRLMRIEAETVSGWRCLGLPDSGQAPAAGGIAPG